MSFVDTFSRPGNAIPWPNRLEPVNHVALGMELLLAALQAHEAAPLVDDAIAYLEGVRELIKGWAAGRGVVRGARELGRWSEVTEQYQDGVRRFMGALEALTEDENLVEERRDSGASVGE
ncbi:hypothetical protein HK101_002542 [Irineochytrium annulatum]|nr:hypothetical protein HK101_002542 [Irineochytrium annulatum]